MNFGELDAAPRWYVIHTHPRQEDRAEANLSTWSIDIFSPKLQERRPNQFTGRPVYLTKPLFPGYIFAHFSTERLLNKICFTRGVHTVVSFGGKPVPVDDEIISILKLNVGPDGFVHLGGGLKLGDKVMIDRGVLNSLTGIFEREIKDSNRVMILLEAVNFQCRIAIEREMLRKAG